MITFPYTRQRVKFLKHETPWFKKLNLKRGKGSETRKLKCPLCPKEYGTKALIYRHLVDSHFYAQVLLDPRSMVTGIHYTQLRYKGFTFICNGHIVLKIQGWWIRLRDNLWSWNCIPDYIGYMSTQAPLKKTNGTVSRESLLIIENEILRSENSLV